MSSNAIQTFLADFVIEAKQEKAHGALCDLFATLHAALALEFVHNYTTDAPASTPKPAPHVPSAPALVPSAPTKKAKPQAFPMCTGLTAKGEACTRKCCPESPETFCSTHLAQSLKPVKETKAQASAPSKKAMRAQVPVCSGKTAKNEACTRKCCPESDIFCSTHLAQSLKPAKEPKKKAPAAAAAKKPKKAASASASKPVPTHNHALTEEVEAAVAANCDLCQSHGNAADPELTSTQFEEISGDLQSRLKSILANIHEIPDDDDEEEEDSTLAKPDEDEDDQAFGDAALESDVDDGEEEPMEEEFNEESEHEESESEADED